MLHICNSISETFILSFASSFNKCLGPSTKLFSSAEDIDEVIRTSSSDSSALAAP